MFLVFVIAFIVFMLIGVGVIYYANTIFNKMKADDAENEEFIKKVIKED